MSVSTSSWRNFGTERLDSCQNMLSLTLNIIESDVVFDRTLPHNTIEDNVRVIDDDKNTLGFETYTQQHEMGPDSRWYWYRTFLQLATVKKDEYYWKWFVHSLGCMLYRKLFFCRSPVFGG